MSNATTPMQDMVDGQLAELQIGEIALPIVLGDQQHPITYKQVHALKIAELRAEARAVAKPTDKASLQALQDVLTKVTRARTGIDKWRKAWQEPWKKVSDSVNAYLGTSKESGLQAEIAGIEEELEAKKKAYTDELAKAAREGERIIEERYQARRAKLLEAGMSIEANGNLSIQEGDRGGTLMPSQIRFFTDDQMDSALKLATDVQRCKNERLLAEKQAKEDEEREAQELKDRLKAKEDEQKAEAAKLKKDREDLEKEREQMADARAETRGADLVVLGATAHGYGPAAMRYEIGDVIVGHGELRHMDADTWMATRERVREAKVKAIEEQKEHMRKQELAEARVKELQGLGAEEFPEGIWHLGVVEGDPAVLIGQLRTMTSDEWAYVLARFKEAAEARDRTPSPAESIINNALEELTPVNVRTAIATGSEDDLHGPPEGLHPLQEGSAVVGAQPEGLWWEVRTEYVFVTSIQADSEEAAKEAALKDGPPCASIIVSRRVVAISQTTELIRQGE